MQRKQDDDQDNSDNDRRKGPSNYTLTFGGIVAIAGLAASGVATYTSLQSDITSLKRGEAYQERTNERLSQEIKTARAERQEAMREFNAKLDRIIEEWPRTRR